VVNDVSGGQVFGRTENAVVVLTADGGTSDVLEGTKDAVAAGIWTAIRSRLPHAPQVST
jgi:phosphopantothenoylcysteine decarboxylase / phosphopantothenate---cysteine ligase